MKRLQLITLRNPSPTQKQRMSIPMMVSAAPRRTGAKRPVDKLMIGVFKTSVDATQVTTTLATITFPCTIVGLRWDLGATTDAGTNEGSAFWAVVVVRDGTTIGNLSLSDGGDFYTPEQNVMAFGATILTQNDQVGKSKHWNGSTKTMRKLMGGDTLVWVAQGVATNTSTFSGVFQFFCKT